MSRVADPKAKEMLLRAAKEIFAARGLAGAKVEDIARHAGVSKGAFYLHFESKEGALRQLVGSFLDECRSHFAPPSAYPGLPDDPLELIDFVFERDIQIYEFLWRNRAVLRLLSVCQGTHDDLVVAFRGEIAHTCRQWVEHLRREGLFRPDVNLDLATILIGGAHADLTLRLLAVEDRPPLEEWLQFSIDTFYRAYGTPELVEVLNVRNVRAVNGIGGLERNMLALRELRSRDTREPGRT